MGNVAVLKAAHHMNDGVGGADVAQKLVAKTLALGSALDKTGDVHKFNDGGGKLLRLVEIPQPFQPLVRHGDHADIGLDGAEGVVGRLCAGVCDGVEEGAFAHIGKTHDT